METGVLVKITLLLSVIGSGISIHKDGCIYNERRSIVNCRGEHWDDIPFDFIRDKSFKTLDLGVNDITSLSNAQRFLELPAKDQIEMIYLDNNKISHLPHHLFDSFSNLQVLDLSNNSLKHLPRRFCHMTSLTALILDGNPIETISINAITCLRNLKLLSLANCNIQNLPVDFLKGSNLEELNLLGNAIKNINEVNFPPKLQIVGTSEDVKTAERFSNASDGGPNVN